MKNIILVHGARDDGCDRQPIFQFLRARDYNVTGRSWYLLCKEHRVIPPAAQRRMASLADSAITESHLATEAVVDVIDEAAKDAQ